MLNFKEYFRFCAQPCDEFRLQEIESATGKQLPGTYRELIAQTGGGLVAESHCFYEGNFTDFGFPEGFCILWIFGNGDIHGSNGGPGTPNSLDVEAPYMVEAWGLPDGVLPIASVDGSAQTFIALNYDLPEFPPRSVLLVNTEVEHSALLADDFDEFITKLAANPNA